MKYEEILPDVLAGRWVRTNISGDWIKMRDIGAFQDEYDAKVTILRDTYELHTWETRPEEIIGVVSVTEVNMCRRERSSAIIEMKIESETFPMYGGRYKLIPVEGGA